MLGILNGDRFPLRGEMERYATATITTITKMILSMAVVGKYPLKSSCTSPICLFLHLRFDIIHLVGPSCVDISILIIISIGQT